jgi:hypothetical protein
MVLGCLGVYHLMNKWLKNIDLEERKQTILNQEERYEIVKSFQKDHGKNLKKKNRKVIEFKKGE